MNTRDNDPLHAAINAKLSAIVAKSQNKPSWRDDWMQLGPKTPELERLRVYQAISDAGDLPDDAGFYLVSWQIDAMTSLLAEEVLRDLDEQMEAIQQQHGLEEGEFWADDEIPPEYEQLQLRQQGAWDRLFVQKLDESGEHEMAELFRSDRERFDQRSDAGRTYFHGESSSSPVWLENLVDHIAMNMEADSVQGPLGYRYGEEDGFWEVIVYPTPVELLGGAVDGEVVAPGFTLDLEGLRSGFDRIADSRWNAFGLIPGEGPYLAVEGKFQGHDLFLRILAYAPDDEDPSIKVDCTRGRIR
ncbi:MAG: hypothetical protein H8E44_10320 [Planctomycetes bacterium]|nr:hypothetical protein [Planctomycetota bacterium]MBL7042033.1 hypothetical protein [Pirellulaceae bacterium]